MNVELSFFKASSVKPARDKYIPLEDSDSENAPNYDNIGLLGESASESTESKHPPVSVYYLMILGVALISLSFLLRYSNPILGQAAAVSKIMPYKTITHPDSPSAFWGIIQKPYPTGAFWTNLVIKNGDGIVGVYPYGVKTLDVGVQISYGASRRVVSSSAITDAFAIDLQIASTQQYVSRGVETYDNFSVTMGYKTTNNGKYRAILVKSSPYITVYYDGSTPLISAPLMRIISVDAIVIKDSTGIQYTVTLGNYQKWFVYCSEPISLIWRGDSLVASSSIRGYVRVAILPMQNTDAALLQLQTYVQRYPTGASLAFSYPSASTACVTISYSSVGNGSLLMLALPHHNSLLPASLKDSIESKAVQAVYTSIWCIKGKMKAVVGDTWKLTYALSPVNWNYPLQDKLSNSQMDDIAKYLFLEVKQPYSAASDVYSFGKQLGKMARLALIADNFGIADARQQALFNLETTIIPWLQGMNEDPLYYDKTYGGLVTWQGISDPLSDFGSGWYSDHHFHFGYFLNAIAVIIKLDMPFYEANKAGLDALLRDICNVDSTDPDFPFIRHKDFFDGHSWASGLFQQANGKGQESSSEAVNAYYGASLYALAMGNQDLFKLTQLLTTMEIQATQTYWHMSSDEIYDNCFSGTKMLGNMGALDVTTTTWFGKELEFVHGINMMPLSPITAYLFDSSYVQSQYPILASRLPPPQPPIPSQCDAIPACRDLGLDGACCPNLEGAMLACCPNRTTSIMSDEWRSYIYADEAVVDKESAWANIMMVDSFGVGNSRANSLLWAASRAAPILGFNSSSTIPNLTVKPACSSNSACDALGLLGECCPTSLGSMLGCCPKPTS